MSESNLPVQPPIDQGGMVEFGSFRNPEVALKEAELVAQAFKKRAESLQLYKQIGSSKHLLIEGWQMLASMYRVTASITSTKFIDLGSVTGWEANAVAIHVPSGQQISSADAMCLSDEENWGPRPQYEWREKQGGGGREKVLVGTVPTPTQQLRSMAQTRAISKVLSNLLKFVARMAGYAGTPAEEMTGDEHHSGGVSQPGRKSESGPTISEAQAKRMFALSKQAGKSNEEVAAILKKFGFEKSAEVTRDKYEAICAAIQAPAPQPADADKLPEYAKNELPDPFSLKVGTRVRYEGKVLEVIEEPGEGSKWRIAQ